MSTHEIPVIRINELQKHPNADTLSIVNVYGWNVCIRTSDFNIGDLAVYIPPDYVVPTTRPEFSFLEDKTRIKVRKLRGIISQGLLIKADPSLKEGENALDFYGITRYEPPEPMTTGGEVERAPSDIYAPKYDVESFNRYNTIIREGEPVVVTEKIHGSNSRYCFSSADNRMYCGSRTEWKRESESILWWKCLKKNTWIEAWCRQNPDKVLYGEVFGNVQKLKYGAKPNDIFFAAFDIMDKGNWLNYEQVQNEMLAWSMVYPTLNPETRLFTWVPILYVGPFDLAKAQGLAEGNSSWKGAESQMREGVVIRPLEERTEASIGRVQLKIVSNRYLENS